MAPTLSRSTAHCSIMVWRHFDLDLVERIGILPEASRQRIWHLPQQGRRNEPMEVKSRSPGLKSCREPCEHSI
jgi:hypothetical protein